MGASVIPGATGAAEAIELAAAASVAIEAVSGSSVEAVEVEVEIEVEVVVVEEEAALMEVVEVVGWAGFVNEEGAAVV